MRLHAGILNMKSILIGVAFGVLCSVSDGLAQDVFSEGFIGRGVSKVVDGDIADARQRALADAQGKVVMEAVSAKLSVEDMAKYFLTLKNLFF